MLQKEASSNADVHPLQAGLSHHNPAPQHDSVFFKNDRMYSHHLARFNFTTYDVRRAQDVINPGTSHRDVLLLAGNEMGARSDHPFLYARVLGIYHVNVIYTGEGMVDYNARRVDFLWVRWFEYDGRSPGWADCKLDSVRFPSMSREGAFGFVDPGDVLRACHIIPAFATGKVHSDQVGLSLCAHDTQDWSRYFVGRQVVCSMIIINDPLILRTDFLIVTCLCVTIGDWELGTSIKLPAIPLLPRLQ
jgi:hypothetical protein